MERRAPVSRVCRARARIGEGVVGVGIRALRVRSSRLAEERREVILWGERGVGFCSWERISESFEVDMVMVEIRRGSESLLVRCG